VVAELFAAWEDIREMTLKDKKFFFKLSQKYGGEVKQKY